MRRQFMKRYAEWLARCFIFSKSIALFGPYARFSGWWSFFAERQRKARADRRPGRCLSSLPTAYSAVAAAEGLAWLNKRVNTILNCSFSQFVSVTAWSWSKEFLINLPRHPEQRLFNETQSNVGANIRVVNIILFLSLEFWIIKKVQKKSKR